jgi:hypothetical protein
MPTGEPSRLKGVIILTLGLICLVSCGCDSAQSASGSTTPTPEAVYVIGVSPFLEKSDKDDVYRRITYLLLEKLPLNSSLRIYDAYHVQSVVRVDIPSLGAFRSGKTRANQFKNEIQTLKSFLAASNTPPLSTEASRAVQFPQFIRFIADNLAGGSASLRVLVLGNPLYFDDKEPGFSMSRGSFPSDGHLLTTEEQSIFGIKNRAGTLHDVVVHFGYFADPWVSEIHHEKIERFWNLFVRGQGGSFGAFCGDLPTLFASFAQDPSATQRASRYEIDPKDNKIEMRRVTREIGLTDWISNENPGNIRTRPPTHETGTLKIGIRWQGDIDLDLYAQPRPGATTLSFRHTTSAEGYYFKDHRSSPLNEYEFIEFEAPVNVRELEAAVNFYDGKFPGGPTGEIRIEFDGGIYVGHFAITADHGNRGRSSNAQREFWRDIDVLSILRLR